MMILYYYKDEWHVASSGKPDAAGFVHTKTFVENEKKKTYHQLFFELWKELKYELPEEKNYCFIFELFTTQNVVIIKPEKDRIIFHGCRNLETLQEEEVDYFVEKYKWEKPQEYKFDTIEQVVEEAKKLNPAKQEGFVVKDKNFNRVKIKCPSYIALTGVGKEISLRKIITIITTNEHEEFLVYFPKFSNFFYKTKSIYVFLYKILKTMKTFLMIRTKQNLLKTKEKVDLEINIHPNKAKILSSNEMKEFSNLSLTYFKSFSGHLIVIKSKGYNSEEVYLRSQDVKVLEKIIEKQYEVFTEIDKKIIEFVKYMTPSEEVVNYKRKNILEKLNYLLDENIVVEYGSTRCMLDSKGSDYDLFIDNINLFNKVALILEKAGMKEINIVKDTKTPLISFKDKVSNIKCDITFRNNYGVEKSELILFLINIDERVRPLIMILKYFAKIRSIDNSKGYFYFNSQSGTLNNFVYTLMMINFLQNRSPPILPVLKIKSLKDNIVVYDFDDEELKLFDPKKNFETKGQLIIQFFAHFAIDFDYENDCISVRNGKYIKKTDSPMSKTNTPLKFCVEDPLILTENCARSTNYHSIRFIRAEFNRAFALLNEGSEKFENIFKVAQNSKKDRSYYNVIEKDFIEEETE
jgi:DNA polymerase sigma